MGPKSAADYSTLLKFGTESDHVTADILQMFKVKGQGHSVTKRTSSKNVIKQQQAGNYLAHTSQY